ncbi:sensor histidine kinase [Tuwongella immobilis]|nr:HAMP domain-containing sensor histidine kinase [Tuwongella immobilis]
MARQESAMELRRQQHEDQIRDALDQRDHALLTQARTLAGMTQSQVQWDRLRMLSFAPLTVLSTAVLPYGHVNSPVMLAQGVRGQFSFRLYRIYGTELRLNEEFVPRDVDNDHREFYQVTTEFGQIWRSRSLDGFQFPIQIPKMQRGSLFDWRFDDLVLDNGIMVRRVMLKAPLTRVRYMWPFPNGPRPSPPDRSPPRPPPAPSKDRIESTSFTQRTPGPNRSSPPRPDSSRSENRNDSSRPERVWDSQLPNILVQCGWDMAPMRETVNQLTARRDTDLQAIIDSTKNSISKLRYQLLGIGAIAFTFLTVGGWLLIGLGLFPLKQLTLAVSQVTERDFRLPIELQSLPNELKPIAQRMTQMLDQLRAAFEREKQATADISHELRTPVAALMTTIEVSLRKPRTENQYRETLKDCRLITQQLSELVERVMTLACLDAGTVKLQPVTTDLRPVIDSCSLLIRPLAEEKGIRFTIETEHQIPITTDIDKLREILMNLLHNAVEYNRPNGSITLTASRQEEFIEIRVTDSGVGISQDMLPRIFERFYRSDPSRQATGIHAGLGLSIVQEYVQRLGGRILVESELNRGSCFRVFLPIIDLNHSNQSGAK